MHKVGIVSAGTRGECIALFFATHGFKVKIYEQDVLRRNAFITGVRNEITVKNLKGQVIKKRIDNGAMTWVETLNQLADCNLLIEAVWDRLEAKQAILNKLELQAADTTPILSDTYLYLPGELSSCMQDNSRFAVAYFYDIEYMVHILELVVHPRLSKGALTMVESILKKGGFAPYVLNEGTGYIYNRLGCMGILSLFRLYDQKILSYQNLGKYLFATKSGAATLNITLKVEIQNDLYQFTALFKALNQKYGDRFYLPEFLQEDLTSENFEKKIAASSTGYQIENTLTGGNAKTNSLRKIYLCGAEPVYNNLIFALLKQEKEFYFDEDLTPFLNSLAKDDPRLYAQLNAKGRPVSGDSPVDPDLIIDFNLESLENKVKRIRQLQNRLGKSIPVLLNTPIYKIEDIAEQVPEPAMVFGMYTQKNYLINTELIITRYMDKDCYLELRQLIKQLTTDCIETKDGPVRPLCLMVLSKMLEAVRMLEDNIADKETINILGVDKPVFKEIDIWGLKNIGFICNYLRPLYGEGFDLPITLSRLITDGKYGKAAGEGFYRYV